MTSIEILYNIANTIIGIAFVPQIRTLLRSHSASDKSLSLTTCCIFTGCCSVMLAYGLIHTHDLNFIIAGFINVVGWGTISSLVTYNRYLRKETATDDYMVGL